MSSPIPLLVATPAKPFPNFYAGVRHDLGIVTERAAELAARLKTGHPLTRAEYTQAAQILHFMRTVCEGMLGPIGAAAEGMPPQQIEADFVEAKKTPLLQSGRAMNISDRPVDG